MMVNCGCGSVATPDIKMNFAVGGWLGLLANALLSVTQSTPWSSPTSPYKARSTRIEC